MSIEIASQGIIDGIHVPLSKFCEADELCKPSSVTAYLGIPFAQPPLGSLRWKRPQRPAPSWKGKGNRKSAWKCDPIQDLRLPEFFQKPRRDTNRDEEGKTTISEDCLYLNIWVPNQTTTDSQPLLPVLVWVYGGSFIFGSASQPGYDGARLCNETGCIVVTLTYRVGVFGFLGSRELAKETEKEGTGNYGAWDIVAALEWIQENIESFGGDCGNVTAFGESAGSILLHYLLLSPEVPANLFARVILESGTVMSVLPRTMPSAQATFDAIVNQLGATASSTEAEKLQLMYEVSAEDLLSISSMLPGRRPRTEYDIDPKENRPINRMDHDQSTLNFKAQSLFGPIWDGVFVDFDFLELAIKGSSSLKNCRNGQKGLMIGYCVDEGTVFNIAIQSPIALQHHVAGFHPAIQSSIRQLYGLQSVQTKEEAFAACAAYSGEVLFQVPIRSMLLKLAQQSRIPTYGYLFAHRPSNESVRATMQSESGVQLNETFGAKHTAELAFVFGMDGTEPRTFERETYPGKDTSVYRSSELGFTMEEQKLSLSMMRYFGKFARQEEPWTALNDKGNSVTKSEEDCRILCLGRFPMIGSHTTKSIAACNNQTSIIPICEQRLGDHLSWTEKVGPIQSLESIGSQKEKQAFWSKDGFKNVLLQYYGDERITFLP